MSSFPRDLAAEVAKFFHGTPEERVERALEAGRETVELFRATLPPGTSLDEARDVLRRNKHRGRRPSPLMEAPRR